MKRSYRFIEPSGVVGCTLEDGVQVQLPVFVGLLKHPTAKQLRALLTDPAAVPAAAGLPDRSVSSWPA